MQNLTVLYKKIAIFASLLLIIICGYFINEKISNHNIQKATVKEVDLKNYLDGINGAIVIYSPSKKTYLMHNKKLCYIRRSPCSTFKIVSSLIALEYKIISSNDSVRKWDNEIFWNKNWNRDIDFKNAFQTSCVWYFRKIIDEIGKDTIKKELVKLKYGNRDVSDWEGHLNTNENNRLLTGFWIESSLKISPKEQVEVLGRIFEKNSSYSQAAQNQLKEAMLLPDKYSPNQSIYRKTGLGKHKNTVVDAWFTGFFDFEKEKIYFCVYLGETEGKDVTSIKAREIAVKIISDIKNIL